MSGMQMVEPKSVDTIYLSSHRPSGETLDALVFYVSADGRNRWKDIVLECPMTWNGLELEQKVLDLCPDFVKDSWFRIEACTHSGHKKGMHGGGEAVFCAKRNFH